MRRKNINKSRKKINIESGNKYKTTLELILKDLAQKYNLTLVREHQFLPNRKFRFDYAFLEVKVAIEYEGMFSIKSRHLTISGYTRDIEKYNLAVSEGWSLVRTGAPLLVNKKIRNFYELLEKIILQKINKYDTKT